jgi:hypothetical protein
MLLDEFAAKMCDLIDRTSSVDQTVAALQRWNRAGKASARQTLTAAIIALRQKHQELAEITRDHDELVADNDQLKEEVKKLSNLFDRADRKLKKLLAGNGN